MRVLLAELKRRNVFKVATIYVVVSWLLLQVASTVFPAFEIPLWASRLLVVLLGLGFPVALIMAWAFDLTPEGIQWQSSIGEHHVHTHAWDWIIAVLLVVAIGLMVSSQFRAWQESSSLTVAAPAPAMPEPAESTSTTARLNAIAVLPFDNLSSDPSDEYFSDGLAEELLSTLGRIGELRVASRTSTAYFKNSEVDSKTIATTLNVDSVLSGSVRRVGDTIRVVAALDRPETGELLWTDTYDSALQDILRIQSEIAQKVVEAVVPVLSPESAETIAKVPTGNPEAYELYLLGRNYLRQPTSGETLINATQLFDRAIEIDPRFAEAYAGRCEASLGSYEFTGVPAHFVNAEMSCHRALTLDDSLWNVHLALGRLYLTNGQYDRAIENLESAIGAQPNAVEPYVVLANVHVTQGDNAAAEAMFERAGEIENSYWRLHNEMGHYYENNSRFDEAIASYKKVAELAPATGIGQDNLGNTYLSIGNLDSALAAFNSSPEPSRWTHTNRGLVYYYKGDFQKAAEDQQQAIDLAPDVHSPWGRLGDAYRHIPGSEERAAAAYREAIDLAQQEFVINPSSWLTAVRLAMYHAHIGDDEQATRFLERTLDLSTDETAYYFSAIAALALGQRDNALDYIGQSATGGFSKELILNDPDFKSLHDDRRFASAVMGTGQ